MDNFFGSIYCWFESLFGLDLAEYLWGYMSPLSTTNQFISIGLWMLGISLGMAALYYYALDHPKISAWWGWLIFLVFNAIINFIVGWQWVLDDYYAGKMVVLNPETDLTEPINVGMSNMLSFGAANMLLSILAFFIFSMLIKWGSTNSPNSPF